MQIKNMCNLITDFQKYFEIVPANTPKLREEAFRVRYQTICQDLKMPGYEPSRFPDGLEIDEYDDCAVHSLLYHRLSGDVAGTVRLIGPADTPGCQ